VELEDNAPWLGQIPSDWKKVPLKTAFKRVRRPVEPELGIITAFRDGQVTLRSNRRVDGFTEAEDYSGYQKLIPGDLAIHSMDAFAGCIGVCDSTGMGSPVLSVCEPLAGNDARYMAYQLRLMADRGWIEALSKSVRERTSEFRWSEAGSQTVALPPELTQTAVADFLDSELGQIDQLIGAKRDLIAKLKDRHNSYLCELVMNGADPGALYDESSIEWVPKKPTHWACVPFFTLGREVSRKNKGMVENNLLSLSYGEVVPKDINTTEGLLPESFDTYQIVEPGDLVFRFTDLQNDKKSLRSALCRHRGIITSAYLAFQVDKANAEFLAYQMRAWDLMKVFYAMGSGLRQSLKFSDVKRMPVLLPPKEEQTVIVAAIEKSRAESNLLVTKAEKAIDLLLERRSALISSAVTGQIIVRGN
jgi:type I restriction enzyme S subunit